MFNGFIYPQEPGGLLQAGFAPINMKKGRISYIRPEDSPIINQVSNYTFKEAKITKTVEEELEDY